MSEEFEVSLPAYAWGILFGILTLWFLRKFLRGIEYKSDKRVDGQTVAVTGANDGIGFEVAKEMYLRGARVLMLCRDEAKGRRAIEIIQNEVLEETGTLVLIKINLASLASIRSAARIIMSREDRLDFLILNAGVMMSPIFPRTTDGFEMQMGTNHLGHFLLTNLLLPKMISTASQSLDARVVVVSSAAHALANSRIRLHDLNWELDESHFSPSQGYFHSKLANNLFCRELSRRLQGSGVTAYAVHPGVVNTNILRHARRSGDPLANLFYFNHAIFQGVLKTPWHGIQTILYCCLDEEVKDKSGCYFKDCKASAGSTYAENDQDAKELWILSEKLVNAES